MKLGFGYISISDFKSIKKLKFDFGRAAGLYFICGDNKLEPRLQSNGVGKSSLFDALSWCLYGKTVAGLRGPDIVSWGGGNPVVSAVLYCDGRHHVITRSYGPGWLTIDERDATQEGIDQLIGMNHATLCHTVILGQGRPLFFDLTPGQKLELFADVLDLDRWDTRSDKANKAARELEVSNAYSESGLENMRSQHAALGERAKELKDKSDQWEEEHQRLLSEGEDRASELRAKIAEYQPRVDDAELAYDAAVTELEPLRRQIRELQDQQRDNAHSLRHLEEVAKSSRHGVCPTCGQKVSRKLVDPAKITAAKGLDANLGRRLALLDEAEAKFIRARDANRAQLDIQKPQLVEAKAKLSLIVDRLKQDEMEGNPLRPLLDGIKQERAKLKEDYEAAKERLAKSKRKQARLQFWVKGFKDVRLHIIEETLAELQLTANAMLEQAGLIGWSVEFSAERENKSGSVTRGLNVTVKSPHNSGAVRWESWSGGEGQRLRVIGALALGEVLLNRAGVEPELEVLDEPSSHLSPQGVVDLVDMLSDRARALGRTIFYADQTAVASDRFAATLTVERGRNGTRVIEA